jgi:hypothetical protein
MSDNPSFDRLRIARQIADRLQERRCRGIKAMDLGGAYPPTDPIFSEENPGKTVFPDLSTQVPSYIISIRDEEGLNTIDTQEVFRILQTYCKKSFRSFVVVLPKGNQERLLKRMKEMKIRPSHYIWV